jgi:sortase A
MKKRKFNLKESKLLYFICVPLAFCLVLYLTVFVSSLTVFKDVLNIGSMFISDKQVDYSDAYDNIFVPSDNSGDTVNAEDVEYPTINKQFGKLKIDSCDIDVKLFFGDGAVPLRNGVGVYAGSFIPGYGRTILVAGHNNTFFNGLKYIKKGDIIKISTSYGNYEYKVKKTKIYNADSKKSYDLEADRENLILYTCYPFDQLGLTEKRFFVYADKLSGPEIIGLYD